MRERNVTGPLLLRIEEVEKMLNLSPSTIKRLSASGAMPPPTKIGANSRWSRAQIQEWVDGGCQPWTEGGAA